MGDTTPDPRPPVQAPLEAPAAARLTRAAGAAEELCAALWEALRDELRQPRARRVAELAERLAQVCSAVAALAVEEQAPGLEPPAPPQELEIAIHDTRREGPPASAGASEEDIAARRVEPDEEGHAAWAESIEGNLERHAVDGLPFAVLLVEVPDVERLAQAEPPAVLAGLLDGVEEAIGPELRCTDTLVRESRGRWWLTASRTDAGGARTLAERLVRTVRNAAGHRGVPLDVAIGIAVCPADGGDAATLAAHADVGLYAARAAGRSVAPVDDA
jgi:GGDEF domain-containing protein